MHLLLLITLFLPVTLTATPPASSRIGFHSDKYNFPEDSAALTIVRIGKNRYYKSLNEYFKANTEVSNVHLIVDRGSYYNEEIWVIGSNIVVEGKGKVHLYCSNENENVMWVSGNNIKVKNFHMTHKSPPGSAEFHNCTGRVLAFDNAKNCAVEKCDLNGCGLAGLHDNVGNENILIRNNYIHNNTVGAYTDIDGHVWFEEISNHPVFIFENNRMVNNGPKGAHNTPEGVDDNGENH